MDYIALIPTEEWLKSIARFFDSSIDGNKICINPARGKGYFEAFRLEKGLDMVMTDITLNKDVYVHRQKSENKGIIIKYLIHTPSSFSVVKDEEEKHVITDGIYVSTSHSFDTNYIKAGYRFQVLSFHLSPDWIEQNHSDDSLILNKTTTVHPFFIFEKMTATILQLAKNLFTTYESNSPYKRLLFGAISTELLAKTLSIFDYRKNTPLKEVIKNQQDINLLLEIREKLTKNFVEGCPTIQSISEEFGISPTKLKSNFKVFYGKSIFQYFQQERMELAKRMIESGNSIADVGYTIGYNNLSKFSSAYRKQFGFNPKETQLT
ncbi:AraC-like DNA-binding protein [Parabacteroides sp. PF5-5]|uniref:helix-turn-helix transcriptional regulator n=1 Tax=unclassified Parabacteroides TaxID=2649774 RepID=UPI002475FFC3|nr:MULTISPECIES: AraC family transcriptional regulator [unclassified Parabacteroides]MDH6303352.1 AraC-like DNA-binding protein [Parabacteroides sp. PH5-39]MDH6314675.1 AraC-like DNA-binding protein [Parabacteroides sp. PF5-13]MDH6318012.1 AraC-like DNA-binding protein [Parabacteroides sp. PH5-13]MDH6322057.1 AraC-like DNA-binding protein [Parabacteroides sp. PH5-8]MDH6326180.1 AraC-like DNA-binding protein [Parabacteroides sp. PH5-41]